MVWRRVLAPEAMSLLELHGVLQAVMGWDGLHLFEFNIRGLGYSSPDLCGEPADAALSAFRFRKGAKFRYIYDMGAGGITKCASRAAQQRFPANGIRNAQAAAGLVRKRTAAASKSISRAAKKPLATTP